MNKRTELLTVFLSATLLTLLFHKQSLGLNLLIYETFFLSWILLSKQFRFSGINCITGGVGLILTALFTVITHSIFSYVLHFAALFIFIGLLIYPEVQSLLTSIGLSLSNLFNSQLLFLSKMADSKIKGRSAYTYLWKSRIFIIPAVIILLFIVLYKNANPIFEGLLTNINDFIQKHIVAFLNNFDFLIVFTFTVSLVISIIFIIRTSNPKIVQNDIDAKDELERKKKKRLNGFNSLALKNEYKAGVFLLFVLNAIILTVNSIDIYYVWFHFEWQGQYLKQFVHEGTYLLIFSLIISIILVLYFFRGTLNFYNRNTLLKYLSYAWLIQNGILAVSVAIRNFWYIQHFALAYKRIGVIIFLALTLYGLFSVLMKVWQRKSNSYLFRTNLYAFFIVLVVSSLFNWDNIIARYNFSHANRSFVHLEFLSTLSDKSLPYLDKSMDELMQIDSIQNKEFNFDNSRSAPMTPATYHNIIEERKKAFIKSWESKEILSWNLPEYLAYKKLKKVTESNTIADNRR